MSGVRNTAIARIVEIDGWTLKVEDYEPRIRDIDLAERAGMKQPRDIRPIIANSREELEEYAPLDVRGRWARTSMPRGGFRDLEFVAALGPQLLLPRPPRVRRKRPESPQCSLPFPETIQ